MKDQVTALMEALRLAQAEIEKLRRKRQDVYETVEHIEGILDDPGVRAAIHNLEPYMPSPSVVPEAVRPKARDEVGEAAITSPSSADYRLETPRIRFRV